MKKVIVAATSLNGVLGKDNQLVWHMPADLKFFKKTTMGHHLLLGRKTFESMGGALPGRTSIILTRDKDYIAPEGHYVVHSIEEGYKLANQLQLETLMILGGAEVYAQTIAEADEIILTLIKAEFEGDAFFPQIDESQWELRKTETFSADEKNNFDYEFQAYNRRS
jgi:dihydrofolate reductase